MKNLTKCLAVIAVFACQPTKYIDGEKPQITYREPAKPAPPIQPRPPGNPSFITLDRLEETILLDLNNITSRQDRENTRYLIACDRTNQGLKTDEFEQGINLALNGLSDERFLTKVVRIGAEGCIYRFDIDDYTLTRSEWVLIEQNVLLDFVSKSTRNQNIQFLTQSLKPYLFGADFVTTVYEADAVADKGGDVYYNLVDQPDLTHNFFLQQGIVVADEVLDGNVLFAGFSESLIALGKTRLLQVIESDNGYCLSTYDTALGGDDLFQNPFTRELAWVGGFSGVRVFEHAAQEHFCTTNAGLFVWRLNNADDTAEIVAPNNIVTNIGNERIDTAIRIGDCANCHYKGAIAFKDQIGRHILSNPAFGADEKAISQIFFRGDKISAVINKINDRHAIALEELDITAEKDPMTQDVIRPLREEMDANQVAAFTFLPTDIFLERLRGTSKSSQVFGALFSGGKVNLAVLSNNFGTLVDELLIFQDVEL